MRSTRGFSLVELLIACGVAIPLLAVVSCLLLGASQTFGALSATGRAHAEFLVLRERLARDIQQASSVVEHVVLDGAFCETRTGSAAQTLVLQLPAVSADGVVLPGVYDFAVYAVQPATGRAASLSRQLFTSRDIRGTPLTGGLRSARMPDAAILVHELAGPPAFTFDRPIASLIQQVTVTITVQASELAQTRRAFPQAFTASFRIWNSSVR